MYYSDKLKKLGLHKSFFWVLYFSFIILFVNSFNTHAISKKSSVFTIVHVWSYKVRVALCKISYNDTILLWYGEKRQSRLDICNWEIVNITGIYNTIKQAINNAEKDSWLTSSAIVFNAFFAESFSINKGCSYKRSDSTSLIDYAEHTKIMDVNHNQTYLSSLREIENKYAIPLQSLELIYSTLWSSMVDSKKASTLLWKKGEDIYISTTHSFIAKENYDIICEIADNLWKTLYKIVPEDHSIHYFQRSEDTNIIIHLWLHSTLLTYSSKYWLISSTTVWIGIYDLLKDIHSNHSTPLAYIVKKLNREDLYKEEKRKFLEYFTPLIWEWIKDIIWDTICSQSITVIGSWSQYTFLLDSIQDIRYEDHHIKIIKQPEVSFPSITRIKKIIWIEKILSPETTLLAWQILCIWDLFSKKHT